MQGYEGEKGRKGTNALYYYGMREATNHPFFCRVCLQTKVRLCCLPFSITYFFIKKWWEVGI